MNRIALLLLLALAAPSFGAAPLYFVSPSGDDGWSGTLPEPKADGSDGPFRTPIRARDALRAHAGEQGLPEGGTVYLRAGTYFLDEPIALEARDSGTEANPVLWQSFRFEEVRLVGGRRLEDFEPHQGEILKRDCADLPGPVTQLLFNSVRQTLARWPNKGEGDIPGGGWTFIAGAVEAARNRSFVYDGDRPSGWGGAAGVQVSIWPNYNWWQTIANVAAIDAGSKTITLESDLPYTIEPGRRYFFQNVLAELDAPGEWFYDAATKVLYFWPPGPMAEAEIVAAQSESIFTLSNTSWINLIGLTLEGCRGDAVTLKAPVGCLVAKSVVRNADGFGVTVSQGLHTRIMGNDIYATGRGGITLDGGDRPTLARGNNIAQNNHIHHFAELWQTYNCGVNISGVGNAIRHNLIHDAPHIGILLNGNDHLIEYNDIHHVCMLGSDNGAFYMGRDWTQRGNKIRNNKIHDVYGFGLAGLGPNADGAYVYESPHQAWGIYLDDCSSGTEVIGNVFYRVPLAGVMIGGGRDNNVENNVFYDCIPALHIDDRWDEYPWDVMHERLAAMKPTEPPYSERYPELNQMGDDPRKPSNNVFRRNVIAYQRDDFRGLSTTASSPEAAVVYNLDQFDPETTTINNNLIQHFDQPVRVFWSVYKEEGSEVLSFAQWQRKGFDVNSHINKDPMFFDVNADDYRFKKFSPISNIGFKPIPEDKIGLYHDEFRASWPIERDTRRDGVEHRSWTVRLGGQPAPEAAPPAAEPDAAAPSTEEEAAPAAP